MAARRRRVSTAVCSRMSCSRSLFARSLSAITAPSARPETESTAKSTSRSTALMNELFAGERPEAKRGREGGHGRDEEDRKTGAANAEVDRRPHDERQNRKGQDVQANRDQGQIAKDDEACRREKCEQRSELSDLCPRPNPKETRQRKHERRDQQHAGAVSEPVNQPGRGQARSTPARRWRKARTRLSTR